MKPSAAYARFVEHRRSSADLAATLRLLEWDQETYLPSGAVDARARQIGTLAEVLHQHDTEPDFVELVDELAARADELTPEQAVDVRETKWHLDRERPVDAALVRQRSELHAHARAVWIEARRQDDFALLAPELQRIVAMERRLAECIDPQRDPYAVLLEGYEPGLTLSTLDRILADVRHGLEPILARIHALNDSRPYPPPALHGSFADDAQRRFNHDVVAAIGFDFTRGRIDVSTHPFSTTLGDDVRLTTRYDPHDLGYSLYSSLHEAGHGLYEQGLDPQARGLARGVACSLGLHESQSRLWENQVGRSRAFWECWRANTVATFPELASASVDDLWLASNQMCPSMIRTEADEATYNLHILLRTELERALIAGELDAADLAAAWRERMRALLGIEPPDDRQGVLQDVHWSAGEFGYFPTYTLGNVYAAQLLESASAELGDLEDLVQAGDFATLLGWLRQNVHRWGRTFRAAELMERITGQPPGADALLRHLTSKVEDLEQTLAS